MPFLLNTSSFQLLKCSLLMLIWRPPACASSGLPACYITACVLPAFVSSQGLELFCSRKLGKIWSPSYNDSVCWRNDSCLVRTAMAQHRAVPASASHQLRLGEPLSQQGAGAALHTDLMMAKYRVHWYKCTRNARTSSCYNVILANTAFSSVLFLSSLWPFVTDLYNLNTYLCTPN